MRLHERTTIWVKKAEEREPETSSKVPKAATINRGPGRRATAQLPKQCRGIRNVTARLEHCSLRFLHLHKRLLQRAPQKRRDPVKGILKIAHLIAVKGPMCRVQ